MHKQSEGGNECAGTARFIARSLEVASRDGHYAYLFPSESAESNRQFLAAAGDHGFLRAAKSRVFRAAFRLGVGFVLPGIIPHYLARKRCLEDAVERFCSECRQVVLLGAGLGVAAGRLHQRFSEVNFIELDRPAALRVREQALIVAGTLRDNLSFFAADLADEPLPAVLGRCPTYDPASRTLFFAEGLLMYLMPERVDALLDETTALNPPGKANFLAFTFMEARADGRIAFRRSSSLVNWWLRRHGEPFRWSFPPEQMPALLAKKDWHALEIISGDGLRSRCLEPAGLTITTLAIGECVAFAQFNGK